ncbi:MAG: tetratricopeptide repeat protein [Actinomycetota bacterium]
MQHVVEVTDADFEQVVIQGSATRPVVVDLWAAWCAPCRTLGPILEKVAGERGGAFLLAKLDVDANAVGNALLEAVKAQGIPTVVAFRDGQPVNMFIGAYPEAEVNLFVDSLLPSEAELVAEEAQAEEEAGDLVGAEVGYRAALDKEPGNRDAAIGLARILVERGDDAEARELVTPLLPDTDAERILSTIRVKEWGSVPADDALGLARREAAAGRWAKALDGMVAALEDDREAARTAMVDVFAVLGPEDPLVTTYRAKLAAKLF